MTRRIEEVLEEARTRITRVEPSDLSDVRASGGLVVDIRPEAQRSSEYSRIRFVSSGSGSVFKMSAAVGAPEFGFMRISSSAV